MLASHPSVAYLSEPFNTHYMVGVPRRYLFARVTRQDEAEFLSYLEPLMSFRAAPRPRAEEGGFANACWRWPRAAWWRLRMLRRRLANCRPLLKDPIAFFSAEWLYERMGTDVIVLIRHPAAFASSLNRLGWPFDFKDFLVQPELMDDCLYAFRDEIERFARRPHAIVDQAVLLWRIFHSVVRYYQREHPQWNFVRHEDLSRRPVLEFTRLFRRLGLRMTPRTRRTIEAHSAARNPREADAGVVHQLRRNSSANVWSWKRRLTPGEIARVRRGTEDVAGYFYADDEW
jgi:hypothetical protein